LLCDSRVLVLFSVDNNQLLSELILQALVRNTLIGHVVESRNGLDDVLVDNVKHTPLVLD
jgi:hypothetical protein